MEEEIIFQVKINRLEQDFELVKKHLNDFEQAGFQLFLESYLKTMRNVKIQQIKEDYEL